MDETLLFESDEPQMASPYSDENEVAEESFFAPTNEDQSGFDSFLQRDKREEIFSGVDTVIDACEVFFMAKKTGRARDLAQYVMDSQNEVCGAASEWWNLLVRYLNCGDYVTAFHLANHALRFYPYDVDIVAAALDSASCVASLDEYNRVLALAESIDKQYWSDRLFQKAITSLSAISYRVSPDKRNEILQRAIEYANRFQRYFPQNENGYRLLAELYLSMNNREEAREVVKNAIKASGDEQGSLCAASCCVFMIDSLLDPVRDRKEIVEYARLGIRDLCQEQPGSKRLGYLLYREAEALDAEICNAAVGKDTYSSINLSDIENVLTLYHAAYDAIEEGDYANTIKQRANMLWRLGNTKERDIPKPSFLD